MCLEDVSAGLKQGVFRRRISRLNRASLEEVSAGLNKASLEDVSEGLN